MQPQEYETLFRLEETHWWFRALRGVLLDACRRAGLDSRACVLDAGCGTGLTLATLRQRISPQAVGCDLAAEAAAYWPRRGLTRMCRGSVNALPFCAGAFDAACCIDVLESDGVDERAAISELCRVVKPGGHLILLVPAYRWLLSPEHHAAVSAHRRYTRGRLHRLLAEAPVRIVQLTHLYLSLLPAVACYRLWQRRPWRRSDGLARSELRALPGWVNETLFRSVNWERRLLPMVSLPFGSSILVVVQKQGAA